MATFSQSLRHVKMHLNELLSENEIFQVCRELGHVWRDRLLNPAVTVHLFVLQLLASVALTGLRHVTQICVSAQAICKAKKRLPLQLLARLVQLSVPRGPALSLWKGLKVHLIDGMSFMTADTPELAQKYGKAKNQRGPSYGFPMPKLLALMDLGGGFIHKVIALPWARSEFMGLARLFKAIGKNALALGDRGLVSFAHLALLTKAGIEGCFRLARWQVAYGRGRPCRRVIKRLGKQDLLVHWTAGRRPKWLSRKRWAELAGQTLTLRQIAFRVHRPGFRTDWAWIITTLLDPEKYPAQELIDLYSKRWQIEVNFRHLKRTLGMVRISAQSVLGVRKEILAFVLLYNLIQRVAGQAALQQGVPADRISFKDALRWLLWASPGSPIPKLIVNPRRVRPSPPRRVKSGRRRFPQLNAPRGELTKPPCEAKL